jgi:hypothetical protein
MANLVTDDAGLPIPQYMDSTSGAFAAMRGSNGAINVSDINFPSDGIFKVKIYAADGSLLPITSSGIPVVPTQAPVNNYVYQNSVWVPMTPDMLMHDTKVGNSGNALVVLARTATENSALLTNNYGARNLFILINVTAATGTITGVNISIPVGTTDTIYKTITLSTAITGVGQYIVSLGSDDATNKMAIPQGFKIGLVHSNTSSITYSVDYQLS